MSLSPPVEVLRINLPVRRRITFPDAQTAISTNPPSLNPPRGCGRLAHCP
jgi:hypothetical protein